MTTQRAIALLACAPFLLWAAACDKQKISSEEIVRAVAATKAAGGARLAVSATATVPEYGGDERERLTASGVMNPHGHTLVEVRWLSKEVDRVLIAGDVAYTDQWRGGKYGNPDRWWVKLPRTRLDREMGLFPATVARPPLETLHNLLAITRVEWAGRDHLRGVDVDRYRGIVNLRQLPRLVPMDERSQARAGLRWIRRFTQRSTYRAEVWVDDRRLIRAVRTSFIFRSREAPRGDGVPWEDTLELFDFGSSPRISPPRSRYVGPCVTCLAR